MKALELREGWSLDHLVAAERPDPEPGLGQVLVRVNAVSLNYRDWLLIQGGYGRTAGTLPLIPVSDGAGEIAAVGDGVTEWKVGDRVVPAFFQDWSAGQPTARALASSLGGPLDGMLAELAIANSDALARIPDWMEDKEAACLPCAGLTAWNAVVGLGGVRPGDVVLVLGTGGVALFAIQFAKAAGATVIVTSKSDEKLARATAMGADHGLNYGDNPDWGKAARQLVGGEGVDLVVETAGATLGESLRAVRPGGTISMMGVLAGNELDARISSVVMRMVRLQGITVGSAADFRGMMRAVDRHRIRPVIDRCFEMDAAHEALNHLAGQSHFGKICLAR